MLAFKSRIEGGIFKVFCRPQAIDMLRLATEWRSHFQRVFISARRADEEMIHAVLHTAHMCIAVKEPILISTLPSIFDRAAVLSVGCGDR